MAGVNSLPSTLLTPAHSVHALAPLGRTLKSTPLAAPHISRSFSSSVSALPCLRSTFPLTIVSAASSDNILQPDKGWPPSLGERTREDSDAQARVITDRSPAIRNVSFFIVRSFFFFFAALLPCTRHYFGFIAFNRSPSGEKAREDRGAVSMQVEESSGSEGLLSWGTRWKCYSAIFPNRYIFTLLE